MRVCVFGATGDIGGAIAQELSGLGHEVIRCGRHMKEDRGSSACSDLAIVDTSSLARLRCSASEILSTAKVDCVINAIGLGRSSLSPPTFVPVPTADLTMAEWEELIYVNLKVPIMLTRLAQKFNIAKVIHVGSALTPRGMRGAAMSQAYSSSKMGLAAYCKAVNIIHDESMSISCVAPGLVKTRMTEGSGLQSLFDGHISIETVARHIADSTRSNVSSLSVLLPSPGY